MQVSSREDIALALVRSAMKATARFDARAVRDVLVGCGTAKGERFYPLRLPASLRQSLAGQAGHARVRSYSTCCALDYEDASCSTTNPRLPLRRKSRAPGGDRVRRRQVTLHIGCLDLMDRPAAPPRISAQYPRRPAGRNRRGHAPRAAPIYLALLGAE